MDAACCYNGVVWMFFCCFGCEWFEDDVIVVCSYLLDVDVFFGCFGNGCSDVGLLSTGKNK